MDNKKIIVPFDIGNATVLQAEGGMMNIMVTANGVKYEFEANPAGITSYCIDGGKKKEYKMITEK